MLQEKLSLLPEKPGCYLHKDKEGNIIYVGKAKNLKRRVSSYFNRIHTGKTKALVDNIVDFDYIITSSEIESLILEINLIKKYNPKYNVLLKDDKTYPYILLTNDNYPSLKIERYKNRKKVKGKLFGPFPNVVSARKTVELINRIYPLRKCRNMQKDVCLYYHINECLGYCKFKINKEQIDEMTKEIESVLNGDYKLVTKRLEEEMNKASDALNFEKAIDIKNMIEDIKTTLSKQIIVSNVKYNFDVFGYFQNDNFLTIETLFIRDGIITGKHHKIFNNIIDVEDVYTRYIIDFYDKFPLPKELVINEISDLDSLKEYLQINVITPKKGDVKKILNMANLNAEVISKEKVDLIKRNDDLRYEAINDLRKVLNLEKLERIEIFDNSHLFGTYYVGAMAVFKDFLPVKEEYRKYKISTENKDDLSAMKEVIYRRYYRALLEKTELPDLIIADGGELQVRAIKEILDSLNLNIKLVGLKKDKHHKTSLMIDEDFNIINITNNNLFLYLTRMQDEVHRYVITYHRNIKSKGSIESILNNVEGIGDKRRKELLKKYGSINKIKNATVEELSMIIPEKVAIELKEYLESL